MNRQKLIPVILVSLSCILFIVAIVLILNMNRFEFSNKTENRESNQSQSKEENKETNLEDSNSTSNHDNTINENNNTEINDDITEESKMESNTGNLSSNQNEIISKDEINVVSYFEAQDNMITATSNQDDTSLREKVKNAFVTIVDFIFYDKEIKGYTFEELTTSAKLKVIKIALSIDNKIDKYFPDYKDIIKDKYDNMKGKLAVKYLEFTSSLCESVGNDTCNQAKEDFNTMKESFGITWQLIKELASTGSSKVKEFYESWRDA